MLYVGKISWNTTIICEMPQDEASGIWHLACSMCSKVPCPWSKMFRCLGIIQSCHQGGRGYVSMCKSLSPRSVAPCSILKKAAASLNIELYAVLHCGAIYMYLLRWPECLYVLGRYPTGHYYILHFALRFHWHLFVMDRFLPHVPRKSNTPITFIFSLIDWLKCLIDWLKVVKIIRGEWSTFVTC